jgi:hypothetical protein
MDANEFVNYMLGKKETESKPTLKSQLEERRKYHEDELIRVTNLIHLLESNPVIEEFYNQSKDN